MVKICAQLKMLFQIRAPHFTAGYETDGDGLVAVTAPIIKYMKGWEQGRVWLYVVSKGWDVQHVRD
jgi:hypothetical protein